MKNIKIVIVEDNRIMARDIAEVIEQSNSHIDLYLAHNYHDALNTCIKKNPDIIFCDINLNDIKDGIELILEIKNQGFNPMIIFISAYSDIHTLKRAKLNSPENYLVKPYTNEQLETALFLAIEELEINKKDSFDLKTLSQQEQRIIHYIAKQMTTKDIANQLFISPKTVENHRSKIAKKLNLPKETNSLLNWVMKTIH